MTAREWLEIGGWVGSALVVLSLTQARVLRFRWLNLAGSAIATAYNAVIGIWPFVAMNGAICLINIYWLVRLNRERHSPAVYETVPVPYNSPYLRYLLNTNAADIAESTPNFTPADVDDGCLARLIVSGNDTVGMVVLRPTDVPGQADVLVDWVAQKYRDFTPGEFVYHSSGVLPEHGWRSLRVANPPEREHGYLTRMGFRPTPDGWVLDVDSAPA